jgi:hypothetical protein
MNKYLLLRDNKQSGPYTVPEIIEKGIKPYDLVWLDGKSLAWRYPSEVEELKAYAPVVEEQPFDRFYKKPEPVIKSTPAATVEHSPAEHSPYEPKVIVETAVEDLPPPKKVYINFPAGNAPVKPVNEKLDTTVEIPKAVAEEKKIVYNEPKPTPVTSFTDKTDYAQPIERIPSYKSKPASNNKNLYYAAAACIVLVGFIAMLLINNRNQQERLKELNTIVKEIENKQAAGLTTQGTQVKNTVPPAEQPQTSETIINPELLSANDYNNPKPAVKETVTPKEEVAVAPKKADKETEIAPGIVYKERPVLRRTDNEPAAPAAKTETVDDASASENIYKLVSVKHNNYKTGVLGGISNLQFELTNNSKRELHRVAIEIKYLGPEKKVVNRQTVYIENVSPGGHTTIDVPKSKRGVSIDYTITDIKS